MELLPAMEIIATLPPPRFLAMQARRLQSLWDSRQLRGPVEVQTQPEMYMVLQPDSTQMKGTLVGIFLEFSILF